MAKVMIVDDTAFARKRCARFLSSRGYEVVEAENGADAVRLYVEKKPDAVLMDIAMPEMDGVAALNEIRRAHPDAKVVLLAAPGQEVVGRQGIKLGARGLIARPFQPQEVLSTLEMVLGVG